MTEQDREDIYLRLRLLHDIVDKYSPIVVNRLPVRFYFFIQKEAWLRESRRRAAISGSLKRSKVWCRLADFLLEFLARPTKGLYETIVVGITSDGVIHRADKGAYQFHYLYHWLGGRWFRETRDVIVRLLEQPVDLTL